MKQQNIITVDNCFDCPFVSLDDYYGYTGCTVIEVELEKYTQLPDNEVHDNCPLKEKEFLVKIKQ